MSTAPAEQTVALANLRLSPKNTRRQRDPEAVAAMAASIFHHGLLQNLIVEPAANEPGVFEVLAGGTRLAAMQRLVADNEMAADHPVRVLVETNGQAIEASAAENLVRTRLSPAEEFDAFKAMADNGKSRDEIAQHFGVARIVVDRSLKLANVAPDLLDIYRAGGMELDQLRALALTDDHQLQRDVWNSKEPRAQWAANIRERITRHDVAGDSGLARFVGLEAYQAAGGAVTRDLFGEKVWLTDRALVESLAMDRLEETAKRLRDDGWSWVETHLSLDYAQLNAYPYGFRKWDNGIKVEELPLPPEQQARLQAIETRIEQIEKLTEDMDWDAARELNEESERLDNEAGSIQALAWKKWPKRVMEQSGCLVYIDREDLSVSIEWARLKPGQRQSNGHVTGTPAATTATSSHGEAKSAPKPAPTLSGAMLDRLHLHHRAGLRHALVNNHGLAMELLLTQLLSDLFTPATGARKLFAVTATDHHAADVAGKSVELADVKASGARKELDGQVTALKAKLPKKAADIQAWLATRSTDELVELFALVAAVLLDPSKDQAKALAAQVKLDMRAWWAPDADRYLNLVPKALAAQAVAEVHGKAAGEKVEALKKDAAIAEAGKLLANTGWLPKPLRGDGYTLTKPGTQPKPAAKGRPPAKAKVTAAKPKEASAPKKAAAKKSPAKKAAKRVAKKAPAKRTKQLEG